MRSSIVTYYNRKIITKFVFVVGHVLCRDLVVNPEIIELKKNKNNCFNGEYVEEYTAKI